MNSKSFSHVMNRWLILTVAACTLWQQAPLRAADANEEQQLTAVLQTDHSPREKDAACAKLKRVGTAQSVPALAALLTDEQLSHSACYALETMPYPEAGQALIQALEKTASMTRVGIINTLGFRRELAAVSAVAKLLADADSNVAVAAARALGKIGGPDAIKALEGGIGSSAQPAHEALADGLLLCANQLLSSGKTAEALPVFQRLYESDKGEQIRVAAYRGMILSSGDRAAALLSEAIGTSGAPGQMAALQLVRDTRIPGVTQAITDLLPKVTPAVQIALIGGLLQRDDPVACSAVAALAESQDGDVRLAALGALGRLGDASVIPILAQAAAKAAGMEQKAARQSLLELRRGNPTEALLAQLATAQPALQVELARALGQREDPAAMPKLLDLAQNGSDAARSASLQALALLADAPQLPAIVRLVAQARSDSLRLEAAETLNFICQHIQSKRGQIEVGPLVKEIETGSAEVRAALLPVCSSIIHPQVREAVRASLGNSEPKIRGAAVRALSETRDPELLPDLLKVACDAPEKEFRSMGVRGCVRLTTQEESVKLPNSQRIAALQAILKTGQGTEIRQMVLSGLGEIADLKALELILPLLDDADVKAEAAGATIKVAAAVAGADSKMAEAALKKALAVTANPATRQAGEAAIKQIQAMAAYITAWQVAGPYRVNGKAFDALFDIGFPPEAAGAQGVQWKIVTTGTDAQRPWLIDLLKAVGGEQSVAYARTWIHSDAEQAAVLEMGSDDGIKVWFNRKLIHANNASRALQPGSDKMNLALSKGWNELLVKVTQNNQGWELCARFLKPDGSLVEGVRFATTPPPRE